MHAETNARRDEHMPVETHTHTNTQPKTVNGVKTNVGKNDSKGTDHFNTKQPGVSGLLQGGCLNMEERQSYPLKSLWKLLQICLSHVVLILSNILWIVTFDCM